MPIAFESTGPWAFFEERPQQQEGEQQQEQEE